MYAKVGRPSIPPEQLLRAQLLQMLYSVRSERLLMEEMDYNILFRWFVGLNIDDAVWDATVFTKNRDRLLQAELAKEFLARVVGQAREKGWASDVKTWQNERCRREKSRSQHRKLVFIDLFNGFECNRCKCRFPESALPKGTSMTDRVALRQCQREFAEHVCPL
jgi:hypothetical protein